MSKTFLFTFLLCFNLYAFAQTTISGTVKDENNEPLIGATILVQGTVEGTNTGLDGSFSFETTAPMPVTLKVQYIGFISQDIQLSGPGSSLDVVLQEDILYGDEVVISASRRPEKLLDAPAAVSIINANKLSVSPQIDPTRNLINVPGVQISQQSANRINVTMRGSAALLITSAFPIMDYRSLVSPGTGSFQADASGVNTIDLQRIEVVRGPGSALYGPGVTTGVIHYISKNPIDYPGTTVELTGGGLETLNTSLRHAWRTKDSKFGYKINAHFRRGLEFTLDPVEDSLQISKLRNTIFQPQITNGIVDQSKPLQQLLGPEDTDPDMDGNPMQKNWFNTAVNATLEFRPMQDLSIVASGGHNAASSVFYNRQGEGRSNNQEYWFQTRVRKGGFFGQFFYVDNLAGSPEKPSFLYQTGLRSEVERKQIEGQLQYNFDLPAFYDANIVAGIDYRLSKSDSEHLVYGRNEDDDDYQIIGGYAQGKFAVTDQLDVVAAGRFDTFSFFNQGSFSPRLAFVYKPSSKHTFRASYNRASAPPSALDINIDLPLANLVPGLMDIWFTGQKVPHTFTNPTIDFTAPGIPNLPYGTPGLPLAVPFGAVNDAVLGQVIPALMANPQTAPLAPAIEQFLRDPANVPAGFTGNFSGYNIFTGDTLTQLVPTDPLTLNIVNSFEVGYKGLFFDKLSVAVDIYRTAIKGFSTLNSIAPTIALVDPNISEDLGAAVTTSLTNFLVDNFNLPAPIAGQIAGNIGAGYAAGGAGFSNQVAPLFQVFGAVESDLIPQEDGITHITAGYRTLSDAVRDHWGADIALEYFVNPDFSAFANYSWVSQNDWIPGEANDDGLPFASHLNVPKNKYRIGVNYTPASGFIGSASFQHDDSFFVDFGQFRGNTDVKNLVDASIGYRWEEGFMLLLSATNLFNNEYRAFPNFPKIGRRSLLTFRYTFGADPQ